MWTSNNVAYHPTYWRNFPASHDPDDSSTSSTTKTSRIYEQNFGPGVFNEPHRRMRIHHMRHGPPPPHHQHFPRTVDELDRMMDRPFWNTAAPPPPPPQQARAEGESSQAEAAPPPPPPGEEEEKLKEKPPSERGMSEVINDNEKFQVSLDVAHFDPEDIEVKAVEEFLIVECKHGERPDDHGFISRSFTRKYILPKDVDILTLSSSYSPEGTLIIHAMKKSLEKPSERKIRIDIAPPTQ